jgi:predicted MFS family arabinose efflux permease
MTHARDGEAGPPDGAAGRAAVHFSTREWALLLALAAVQFTHIVDFMIVMPLGPVLSDAMTLTPAEFGWVVSAYTAAAGVAGLVASRFLDRFDRKRALLFLYTGFVAGTLLCAFAPYYGLLLAARTVAGAFGGIAAAVVLAIVGDVFADARRGTATGVIMSAFSVASVAGVPFGLYLADELGWQAPFLVLGGLSAAVLVLMALLFPPLRGHLHRGHPRTGATWAVLTDPNHLRAYALMVFLVLTTFIIIPYLPIFHEKNVGLEQRELKFIYLCGGAATLLTLTPIGRVADRRGKLPVFRVLAVVTIVPILLLANLPADTPLALVLAVTTLMMITTSGRMVPATALITASSAPRYRGSFMSLNTAVQHLAAGAATALGGALLGREGETLVGYPLLGVLATLASLFTLYLAGRLRAVPGGEAAPDHKALAVPPPAPAEPDPAPSGPVAEVTGCRHP